MNKKAQVWTIVLVAVIVAVAASLITAGITANVIKVQTKATGPKVYTTDEIDAKLKKVATNQEVLDMLNSKCNPTFHAIRVINNYSADPRDTDEYPENGGCSFICKNPEKYPNTFRPGEKSMISIGAIVLVQEKGANYPIFSYFVPQNISKQNIAGYGDYYGTQNDVLVQCICCSA